MSGDKKYGSLFKMFVEVVSSEEFKKKIQFSVGSVKTNITKEECLVQLSEEYRQTDNIVFVLGAGVSFDFGIPTWDKLLQQLMISTFKFPIDESEKITELFQGLFSPSAIISGRYIQKSYEDDLAFIKKVRQILYANIDQSKKSNLVDEIIGFCCAHGKHQSKLNSIITFNFDDIIESKLRKIKPSVPFKEIYGLEDEFQKDQLPIYHVHGYLPHTKKLTTKNTITLGESGYHQQYTDMYSWNNIIQLNKFRENPCLFIGTSLTDPNTRRLLDIAFMQKPDKEKRKHYIIRKTLTSKDIGKMLRSKNLISNPDDYIQSLKDLYEHYMELDAFSLGLNTIWVETYEEYADILKGIRSTR